MRPVIKGAVFIFAELQNIVGSAFEQSPIRLVTEFWEVSYGVLKRGILAVSRY